MKNPFEKKVPSVFSINTPFQALCAIAAIRQLEIEDYKFLVFFPPHEARNVQLRNILEKYNIKYETVKLFNSITGRWAVWSALRKHRTRFRRLFIGDFRAPLLYYMSLRFVSDGTDVVYLDDGNITISLLKDIINEPLDQITMDFLKKIEIKREIYTNKNILTIYDNIDNPKYRVMPLNLSLIMRQQSINKAQGVYIVGTNLVRYCEPLNISADLYIKKLEELIAKLRIEYPEENVIFIPHGRDRSEYAQNICAKYGASFEPSEMTIELKLLNQQAPPKVVYGFTSSALYNIKKMFPRTRVVNVVYKCQDSNPYYQEIIMCSDYYSQNGIELMSEYL